jgi:hypothetical protein
MWFLFCIIWGIGGPLDEDGRKKFDALMRELDTRYPSSETVFEYLVEPKMRAWVAWETKLSAAYKPSPDTPFFKILVPTVGPPSCSAESARHGLMGLYFSIEFPLCLPSVQHFTIGSP